MNKLSVKKTLLLCLTVSLVLIVAGAFLFGFLGFNPDSSARDLTSLEVADNGYMTVNTEYRSALEEFCSSEISEGGYDVQEVSYTSEAAGGAGFAPVTQGQRPKPVPDREPLPGELLQPTLLGGEFTV